MWRMLLLRMHLPRRGRRQVNVQRVLLFPPEFVVEAGMHGTGGALGMQLEGQAGTRSPETLAAWNHAPTSETR